MAKGNCSGCKKGLTPENAPYAVFKAGFGICRECANERQKIRARTLGGRFRAGKTQSRFNGRKWELSIQQYAAIVAFDKCFYCDGPLPKAACGLDRELNENYSWDAVLPCCGKQPKAVGPRGCNEQKGREFPPILQFVRRWYEKNGKLPTVQDFNTKLQKFKAERDSIYKILCGLNTEEVRKMKQSISVQTFLATLERKR